MPKINTVQPGARRVDPIDQSPPVGDDPLSHTTGSLTARLLDAGAEQVAVRRSARWLNPVSAATSALAQERFVLKNWAIPVR